MKKIFTLAAAVLASMAMMAQEFTFTGSTLPEGWTGKSLGSSSFSGEDNSILKVSSNGTLTYTFAEAVDITSIDFTFSFGSKDAGKAVDLEAFGTNETSLGTAQLTQAEKQTGSNIKQEANIEFAYSGVKKFTITNSSDKNFLLGYLKFNTGGATPPVPATKPCTTVTIEGPENAFVGDEVTFKATGFDATPDVINWYDGNFELVSETDTYKFTPTAAGDYMIQVTAWNAFNTEGDEAFAYTTLKVSDPADVCGELIKAVHKNKNTADVSGIVGGTADKNTQDNGKLGSNGHYFGVKLAHGKFQAGDEVTIVASALNGGNTATIYSDKGTTLLGSVDFDTESLTATYTLEEETEWVYLYRAGSACNPSVESITVTRSCEASDNNDIKSLTINGEAVEAVEGVYSYTVGASVNLAAAQVVYTLAHPKATATPASGFMVDVPNAGDPANTQVITVTAQNGDQATYTVSVTKSAELSKDASLKALSVDGYTLDPEFAADVYAYTITKAYGAENPAVSAVHATANDANAQTPVVELNENAFTITVTAEDGVTQKVYTINILTAAAPKDLLEVSFSNGVHGFIKAGEIKVPYIAGAEAPTYVETRFASGIEGASAELVEGGLKVVGADADEVVYPIIYEAVPVADIQLETAITFDSTENYIYSVYGWDASKGWKIAKDVEEAANKRISEGKDRIYMALPAADSLYLTSGSGKDRPVMITVNGVASDVVKLAKQNEEVAIALNASANNFVCIESNGSNGDGGIIAIRLHKNSDVPSALDNTAADAKVAKRVINGQLFIEKNGALYNAQGAVVK